MGPAVPAAVWEKERGSYEEVERAVSGTGAVGAGPGAAGPPRTRGRREKRLPFLRRPLHRMRRAVCPPSGWRVRPVP